MTTTVSSGDFLRMIAGEIRLAYEEVFPEDEDGADALEQACLRRPVAASLGATMDVAPLMGLARDVASRAIDDVNGVAPVIASLLREQMLASAAIVTLRGADPGPRSLARAAGRALAEGWYDHYVQPQLLLTALLESQHDFVVHLVHHASGASIPVIERAVWIDLPEELDKVLHGAGVHQQLVEPIAALMRSVAAVGPIADKIERSSRREQLSCLLGEFYPTLDDKYFRAVVYACVPGNCDNDDLDPPSDSLGLEFFPSRR
jgi:hypothetical protein